VTHPQRTFSLILAALLISAGLYGLWWAQTAEAAKTLLEGWIEARRSGGFEITHDGIETAGFPLRIELVVSSPKMVRAGEHPFSWQGPERMIARIGPLAPDRLILSAAGAHLIETGGQRIAFSSAKAEAAIDMSAGGLSGLHLMLEAASIEAGAGQTIALSRLSLDATRRFDLASDDLQTPSAALALSLDQLTLPAGMKASLGDSVPALRLNLLLRGPVPESLRAEPLKAWSEAGGVLDLERLHLEWGPLVLDGDGTLALDRGLMPIAPFGFKTKGAFEAIDALAERGLIEPANAMVGKLALSVLAKEPPDPDTGLMRLPLTLQGRDLFLGAARLARLPAPSWVVKEE